MCCTVFGDSGFKHADTVAVTACLNYHSLVLDTENSADDTAYSDDLICDLKIFTHFLFRLCTLLFGADKQEIENHQQADHGGNLQVFHGFLLDGGFHFRGFARGRRGFVRGFLRVFGLQRL